MFPAVIAPNRRLTKLQVLSANSTLATILAHFRPPRLALAMNSLAAISIRPDTIAIVIRKFWVACSWASVACLWLARSAFSPVAPGVTAITRPMAVTAAPAYIRRAAITTDLGGSGRTGATATASAFAFAGPVFLAGALDLSIGCSLVVTCGAYPA